MSASHLKPEAMSAPSSIPVDARVAPESAVTMAEVRAGVDALDRALVALIAERQRYMDAAARIKPDRDAVHDDWRINDVLAKVRAAAEAEGLSWALAEPVWRTMIDRCIAHEFEVFDRERG